MASPLDPPMMGSSISPAAGLPAMRGDDGDQTTLPDPNDPTAGDPILAPPPAGGALPGIIENDDGSATVLDDEGDEKPDDSDFYRNLAKDMDPGRRSILGSALKEAIDRDKEARKKRDEQYAEGIRRTGLGDEAPGGAQFAGASRAVHPVLVEACIDFAAKTMKELFPAKGPVKAQIIGKQTEAKLQKAKRKKEYMNWQLTRQAREYRTELEQLLTQLPLGGSQYMKNWYDPVLARPRFEFVPIDDLFLPFASTDFYTTPRVTHAQHLTKIEFDARVDSGLYRKTGNSSASGVIPDQSASATASDKIEGRDDSYNEDGLRDVFEVQVAYDLSKDDKLCKDGRTAPYVVTIDDIAGDVLSVYRNWKPDDERREKLHWLTEFAFIPWRGAYAIGLGQAIGSLAGAATGALRALLDSAHISNMPTAIKLKGGRGGGQTIELQPTGISEIDGPAAIDDIRKLAMALPFPGPSPVLFQLLGLCVDAARDVVATASEKIADANQNTPVGTTLAMIEQGSITFSAVHARLHESQRRVLEVLHRLDAEHLDDEETVEDLGELIVYRTDFQGPMDVAPVSDPNIFSDTQRYAQQQAVLQLRGMFAPQSFNDEVLLERTLDLLNYPDYQAVLNTPTPAERRSAIDENMAARDKRATLKAYEDQDDLAHLKVHVAFMTSPVLCASPMMGLPALPKLVDHCGEHIAALYQKHARAAAMAAKWTGLGKSEDSAEAEGVVLAEQELMKALAEMMPHIQSAAQMALQLATPKPPPDGTVQAAQIRDQGETVRTQAKESAENEREQMRLAAADKREQDRLAAESQREQTAAQVEIAASQAEEAAESARHAQEMAASERNAALAAQSERDEQMMDFMTKKMSEAAESQREDMRAQIDLLKALISEHAQTTAASVKAGTAPPEVTDSLAEAEPSTQQLMMQALAALMQQHTAPRAYSIRKQPDGTMQIVSDASGTPMQ
jgi:chaperonin GroES